MGTLHIWIFAFASWDGLVTRTVQAQEKITLFLLKLHPVVSGWSVGGVICLVNSDNERDSVLLNSNVILLSHCLLRGTGGFKPHEIEQ